MRQDKDKDFLRAYHSLGLDLTVNGTKAYATCPFCLQDDSKTGEGHFYVQKSNGIWGCAFCAEGGNVYTFLQKYHGMLQSATSKEHYKELSKVRGGLSWLALRKAGWAYNPTSKQWFLPVNNPQGSLSNLRIYDIEEGTFKGTGSCKMHLYQGDKIKPRGPILLCEGEHDAIALQWLLEKLELDGEFSVCGVPGATHFKEEWLEIFQGRKVWLLYDNDPSGKRGMERAAKLLTTVCREVKGIVWPADSTEGYDVNDLVAKGRTQPKETWETLKGYIIQEYEIETRVNSFPEVVEEFKKYLYLDQKFIDGIALTFAAAISVRIPGDSIWLFLVGPPGMGKSVLINSLDDEGELTEMQSKLTSQSLVSGFKGDEGGDTSLLPRLRDKCLMVNDYTAIKSMPISVQEELYGLLRDAYGGKVKVQYGNGTKREYTNLFFSLVAGVTQAIHGDRRATLGERFLRYNLLAEEHDVEQHIRSAMENTRNAIDFEPKLREVGVAFLHREWPTQLPTLPAWYMDKIIAISRIVSYLRATVEREQGSVICRAQAEIGTRLGKQLLKLSQALCWVYDLDRADQHVFEIIHRVAFDTATSMSLEIVRYLENNPDGCTREAMMSDLHLSKTTLQRSLDDLRELKVVSYDKIVSRHRSGHPTYLWKLSEEMSDLLVRANPQVLPTEKRSPSKKKKRRVTG